MQMKIKRVKIRNFRSIKEAKFNLLPYMVFVGKNNSGKSNLMIALDAFFSASVNMQDFRKEDGKHVKTLSITVLFHQLNKDEKILYEDKLINEGEDNEHLIMRLKAKLRDSGKIDTNYKYLTETIDPDSEEYKNTYGFLFANDAYRSVSKIMEHPQIPQDFKDSVENFCEEKGSKRLAKKEYNQIRRKFVKDILEKNPSLKKKVLRDIKIHSRNNKDMLGNFFFIPAVQDIEDETRYTTRGKKNLNQLMDYVLDQMQDMEERSKKEQDIQQTLKELYQLDEKTSEINKLRDLLNEHLATFDGSKLSFDTKLPNLSKIIRDCLKIYIDDGIKTEVQYKGHGLQRYFMVVLFRAWSEKLMSQESKKDSVNTSTFFSIEEPELFLHPQYQRMMGLYLQNIAED